MAVHLRSAGSGSGRESHAAAAAYLARLELTRQAGRGAVGRGAAVQYYAAGPLRSCSTSSSHQQQTEQNSRNKQVNTHRSRLSRAGFPLFTRPSRPRPGAAGLGESQEGKSLAKEPAKRPAKRQSLPSSLCPSPHVGEGACAIGPWRPEPSFTPCSALPDRTGRACTFSLRCSALVHHACLYDTGIPRHSQRRASHRELVEACL